MSSIFLKFAAMGLIFCGEAMAIYAEIAASKNQLPIGTDATLVFWKMFLLIALAGAPLIAGYMIGVRAFHSIWVVAVISITSIVLIEPVLAYLFFRELPTLGAGIGFILGALGLAAALFV